MEDTNLMPQEKNLNTTAPDAAEATTPEAPVNGADHSTESPAYKTFSYEEIEAMTCPQIVDAIALMSQSEVLPSRRDVDALKKGFDRKKSAYERAETDEAKAQLEEAKLHENRLHDILETYRLRYQQNLEEERKKQEENYELKRQLIETLRSIVSSQDDFSTIRTQYYELEEKWKSIGQVPEAKYNDLQAEYSRLREEYYDLRQMNEESRAYDFRKNLEAKQDLIAQAEELSTREDIIEACKELQQLHREWKEIGPVEKSMREEIWARFNELSHDLNRRRQEFFDNRNAQEEANLSAKQEICLAIESLPIDSFNNASKWKSATEQVLKLQEQWKETGHAPRSESNEIYKRFRSACNFFFDTKAQFFQTLREQYDQADTTKRKIIEEAEALASSTDWNKTAKRLKELQEEWRKAGRSSKRVGDELWARFRTACDTFFEARKKQGNARNTEQVACLKEKREIISEIEALTEEEGTPQEEMRSKLNALMERFNAVGHVPYRDKEKVYNAYYRAVDKVYEKFQMERNQRRLEAFASDIDSMGGDLKKLEDELERLYRTRERMSKELQTSTGNLDLFSVSSKWGDSMMRDIEQKQQRLKRDLASVGEKIRLLQEAVKEARAENK
ncbi:DUF349 domain-containing protein [Porphyromonas endodontalis]|uniref:DUF349 domain-containing protein n=1 Tax=Porphyromonas endodontalis TaxID=28124 RepID=UPI0028E73F64|nr:DUF349 domain-containing protein [Porphyromonas endodontalis]